MNGGGSAETPVVLGTTYSANGHALGGSSIRSGIVIYALLFLFLGVPLLRAIDKGKR